VVGLVGVSLLTEDWAGGCPLVCLSHGCESRSSGSGEKVTSCHWGLVSSFGGRGVNVYCCHLESGARA
jgi:hypothetical protein